MRLQGYETLVFDCDGVVLDSNAVKTRAFHRAALPWGEAAANALVAHHVANGGISRYEKMRHFLAEIVPELATAQDGPGLDALLQAFSTAVREELSKVPVAEGLEALRDATADARWLIVSGGDEAELREAFAERGLDRCFDGGIFGSPTRKDVILSRELERGNISGPAVYLGDSKFDYECARAAGLEFIFVSGWSEVRDWRPFVAQHGIESIEKLSDLLPH
ncbi:HAD family hydrolase [Wenzhouxiangella marina]|uniref:phosphoglycolate phosphatase n=1 Tax=Wenzhouxiangella marina TaxID=1579979 RepID=A0A0K0XWQ0_9GAMM|nr:HAD family hydrolase [Wenzhouxiangella marina]AKS42129.1 HAD family hydrolase [Wenzhouxiangella marina]MBB6086099.1 phosphoglycolate phosphatase-like HAD superfamily hydrolase [Wenzhouxiangella marina]